MTDTLSFQAARLPQRPLDPGTLHLWRLRLASAAGDTTDLWSLLSDAEQDRAERLATETLRERYVRSHGRLRLILSHYLRQDPQDIVFRFSDLGKPSVEQGGREPSARIEFNLSGSHDLALVAVRLGRPVGVDCELIRPRREILGIARRMFSPAVAQTLEDLPAHQRIEGFYAAWTTLEAQVKADGRGLFRPRGPVAAHLTTAQFRPAEGYLGAAAAEQLPGPDRWACYEWSG